MQIIHHSLQGGTPGTLREIQSIHFGPGGGEKALIQASLHTDEIPPMLVAHHLRQRLTELEQQQRLRGEVVLVPCANPLGMSQQLFQRNIGRFDLASGANFNRHYTDLVAPACEALAGAFLAGQTPSTQEIRATLRKLCVALPEENELASLRKTLLALAIDADIVLDLHCDHEAILHLYTATPLWPSIEPLARFLGAELTLLAVDSGDAPFDETCSMIWSRLANQLTARLGRPVQLENACVAATVELRGELDVEHSLAERDADALLKYLGHRGLIELEAPLPALPKCTPRPLAGCVPLKAPCSGIVIYHRSLGDEIRRGDVVGELIDPVSGERHLLISPIDGTLLTRDSRRFVYSGANLAKISGELAVRSGKLLSP